MIYLGRFAHLIRLIFEQSKRKLISLEEELELLTLYLDLEKLRFNEKVIVHLIIPQQLKEMADEIMVPPLLLQPLIENSFKHGLLHKENGGQLWIRFEQEMGALICTIKDNGVGREKATELNSWRPKEYQSSGLQTAHKRLRIFNTSSSQEFPTEDFFQINDLRDTHGRSNGTEVVIKISLLNNI